MRVKASRLRRHKHEPVITRPYRRELWRLIRSDSNFVMGSRKKDPHDLVLDFRSEARQVVKEFYNR